jgi:hypothetical protein
MVFGKIEKFVRLSLGYSELLYGLGGLNGVEIGKILQGKL